MRSEGGVASLLTRSSVLRKDYVLQSEFEIGLLGELQLLPRGRSKETLMKRQSLSWRWERLLMLLLSL